MNVIATYKIGIVINGAVLLTYGHSFVHVERYERHLIVDNNVARYWSKWEQRFYRIDKAQFDPKTHGQLTLPGF